MSKAVFVHEHGGPEVLRVEERQVPAPGPGEVTVRHRAIGLNFIDVYQRSGLYPMSLPFVAGNEAAGEVTAVGPGVTDVAVGDRVAYHGPTGAYAVERNIAAGRLAPLPAGVDFETAAAVTLKGLTAYYLLFMTWPLKAGESTLIHAAAGGVGILMTQWAKAIGATVLATAGSEAKVEMARAAGADHVINYQEESFSQRVRELTGGRGVDVVYDPVGGDYAEAALRSMAWGGRFLVVGFPAGIPKIPLNLPLLKTCQIVGVYSGGFKKEHPQKSRENTKAIIDLYQKGRIKPLVSKTYPLAKGGDAIAALAAREALGKVVVTIG